MAGVRAKPKQQQYQQHKQRKSIHDTVHLLLSLLSECGLPKPPSECFRQAKFNQQEATNELWKLLFHTIQITNCLDGDVCVDTITYRSVTTSNVLIAKTTVRHYLYTLGYQRMQFYAPFVGSRELLLAFAWLLDRKNLFSSLTIHFIKFAHVIQVPLRPTDQYLIEKVLEDTRMVRQEWEKAADSFKQSNSDMSPGVCVEALHRLVWLKGQLDMKWRAVQRLRTAYQKLSHTIHRSTYSTPKKQAGVRGHLSAHEVFLLRYPNQMKAHLTELGRRVNILQKLIEWRDCEPLFWQWMESVLDLQEEEESGERDRESTDIQTQAQLESVETLFSRVCALRDEYDEVIRCKKSQVDRLEQVWQHKSRLLPNSTLNGKLHSVKAQLCHEYPISAMSTNDETALTTTMVQQVCAIDRPVYAPVQNVAKQAPRPSRAGLQVQRQEPAERLVLALREHVESVAQEIAVLEGVAKERRSEIRRSLEALEKTFPPTVCKIDSA